MITDAPERGQAYGRVAQKALAQKINQRQVQVKYKKEDRYGRILGEVFLNDESINYRATINLTGVTTIMLAG